MRGGKVLKSEEEKMKKKKKKRIQMEIIKLEKRNITR